MVVADAHLGVANTSDEEAFLAFLDAVPSLGDSLLLAGDIYDFWFTYKRLIPRHCIRVNANRAPCGRSHWLCQPRSRAPSSVGTVPLARPT